MKYAWHKKTFNIVNILVSGIFHGHFAQRLAVNKPCLQIVRRLLWKQTTTHSIRNNNPIFDREEPLVKQIRPTVYKVPVCQDSHTQTTIWSYMYLSKISHFTVHSQVFCYEIETGRTISSWCREQAGHEVHSIPLIKRPDIDVLSLNQCCRSLQKSILLFWLAADFTIKCGLY